MIEKLFDRIGHIDIFDKIKVTKTIETMLADTEEIEIDIKE